MCYVKTIGIFLLLLSVLPAFCFEDGIRIAWDYQSARHVTNGVYAGIHPIHDGQWG